MTQVLEYIKQNYTLFLFVAIIILLAVIGYYADKTNFGQKNNKSKNIDNTNAEGEKTLETKEVQKTVENLERDVFKNEISNVEEQELNNVDSNDSVIKEKTKVEIDANVANTINQELKLINDDILLNVQKIKNEEIESKKKEEAFAKFSNEFDEILPKREKWIKTVKKLKFIPSA